jgi:alcohol dehydrogenase
MRSYRFDDLKGFDSLRIHEEPTPKPGKGEVLVRIHAVSLNYRDIAPVLGRYVWNAKTGLTPCSDAAGEVVAVGEGVRAYKPGDRVISAFHPRWFGGRPPRTMASDAYGSDQDGWLTEFKAVSQEAVVPLPDHISYADGCTLPCAGLTAWTCLSGATPMRAGQTVLTLGTGGVSLFAVQIARMVGASVIGTTSSDAKAQRLKDLGVQTVVNYRDMADWGRHIKREVTKGLGVDCVVEVGGPATVNQSLTAVRWGGEVVLVGFLSEENPGIDYFHLKGSGATVRAIGVGDRASLEDFVRAWASSGQRPVIDATYAFADAPKAFEHMRQAAHMGKIVISVA